MALCMFVSRKPPIITLRVVMRERMEAPHQSVAPVFRIATQFN
jgi:hypothetical protein